MDTTLRTKETQAKYEAYLKTDEAKECCFCREARHDKRGEGSEIIKEGEYWYLMPNDYPYSKVYEAHDLLFSKRHVGYNELTHAELMEFEQIIELAKERYDQCLENWGRRQSQKNHFHIHLCSFIK